MLTYRHASHAGNAVDVIKHCVLSLVLRLFSQGSCDNFCYGNGHLHNKDEAFCYIDTHAGAGQYDLGSEMAQKNCEFIDGIGRIWPLRQQAPTLLTDYFAAIAQLQTPTTSSTELRYYPGSPQIAAFLRRQQDHLQLCELQNTEISNLRQCLPAIKGISIHHQDSYSGLKALLPPVQRRGVVLIDPPFELKDEFQRLYTVIEMAYRRWSSGTYIIWFPLFAEARHAQFIADLTHSSIRKQLLLQFVLNNLTGKSLHGCGLVMINPPWQLEAQLDHTMPWLSEHLLGQYQLDWLVSE